MLNIISPSEVQLDPQLSVDKKSVQEKQESYKAL